MLNRKSGLTLIEILFAAIISILLITSLFYTFSTGESCRSVSLAKVDLQAQVRRAMDWIMKDVRQTVIWDIANDANSPSSAHIKFRRVQGWDVANSTYLLSSNYIEYTYNASLNTIVRSDSSNPTQTWNFNNIIQSPFYTLDTSSNVVPLTGHSTDLLTSRSLVVVIAGQKQVKGSINVTSTLTTQVRIRNE